MKTLFIAAGPIEWGSSRMRAWWPAQHMAAADVLPLDQWQKGKAPNYDAYIFQKRIDLEAAAWLRGSGQQVWFDACDPAWWWEPDLVREIARNVTGFVFSSDALLQDFLDWMKYDGPPLDGELQAHVIPDRVELGHFTKQRQHRDVSPVRFIWYGIALNRVAIYAALANLERLAANGHEIELTLFDDRPGTSFNVTGSFPIYYTRWELERENEVIANHDIALLGRYPGPWGEVKSDNRKATAWACGLPATDGTEYCDIRAYMNSQRRQDAAVYGLGILPEKYDVRQSASEWMELLNQ